MCAHFLFRGVAGLVLDRLVAAATEDRSEHLGTLDSKIQKSFMKLGSSSRIFEPMRASTAELAVTSCRNS